MRGRVRLRDSCPFGLSGVVSYRAAGVVYVVMLQCCEDGNRRVGADTPPPSHRAPHRLAFSKRHGTTGHPQLSTPADEGTAGVEGRVTSLTLLVSVRFALLATASQTAICVVNVQTVNHHKLFHSRG